jgi:pimeloyl-ACP methyl ester carboxylesterase
MSLVVPVPSETFDVDLEDGAQIRVRRHGNRNGVRLTVTHGNGFAADAYLPFWDLLTPHYDVLVFDFRNHGQNTPADPPNHFYAQLSRDLARVRDAIDARLGNKTTVGIFLPCRAAPP